MLEMLEMLLIKKEILLWFPFKGFSLFLQRLLIDAAYAVSIARQTTFVCYAFSSYLVFYFKYLKASMCLIEDIYSRDLGHRRLVC